MIIHQPEIVVENNQICVSAAIELQTSGITTADRLWFKFPNSHKEFITDRADGFTTALLVLAMTLGENIEIRGTLSPHLMYGIQEYQSVLNCWFPDKFKLVDVRCNHYKSCDPKEVKGGIASSFSGGVDSFYTLWSHLPQNETIPGYQISHALFIHGYDIFLKDASTYHTALQAYEEMMQKLGIKLLTACTNVRQFDGKEDIWTFSHGAVLTSIPLVLGKLINRYYLPSSHTYNDLFPWGSDPRLDHLLSTETLEVFHDGANVTRVKKTAAIAQWSETYSRLRVCWVKPDGLRNCCQCDKCIRTMLMLDMVGALSKYSTFPEPLERQKVRNCKFEFENDRAFAQQIIEYATALEREDIVADINYALANNFNSSLFLARQIKHRILSMLKPCFTRTNKNRP